jgi:predicted CoA-binding protein
MPNCKQTVKIGAKALWLQFGIQNTEAEKISNSAGITCIMNRCIKQEYQKLFLKSNLFFQYFYLIDLKLS